MCSCRSTYRLAPEVKLPAIIEDVHDAFRWLRSEGSAKFHIDPRKVVVSGGSAGGYLTMMTGIAVDPRPDCAGGLLGIRRRRRPVVRPSRRSSIASSRS